jgi:hypothetical protein
MSGLNQTVRVYVTPNVPVMGTSYSSPCEAYFIVEELLQKGSSPLCRRNQWTILGMGKNQADLELVPVKVVWVQQPFVENPPCYRGLHMDVGLFPTNVSVCTVPHQPLVLFSALGKL